MFGGIAFSLNSNFLMAQGSSSSALEDFLNYRDQYGISTARLDMQDNQRIDNSLPFLEIENFEPPETINDKKSTFPEINLLTERNVPDLDSDFIYHWEQGKSISGNEYSSYIND